MSVKKRVAERLTAGLAIFCNFVENILIFGLAASILALIVGGGVLGGRFSFPLLPAPPVRMGSSSPAYDIEFLALIALVTGTMGLPVCWVLYNLLNRVRPTKQRVSQ